MKPRSKAAVLAVLGATALMAGSCATQPQANREAGLAVHRTIVEHLEYYETLQNQTKVIAGCIDWQASTVGDIAVKGLYPYVTAIYSDAPIFTSELMTTALRACDSQRAHEGWACECVAVDKNGRAVLDVPESFRKQFAAARPSGPIRSEQESNLVNAALQGDLATIRRLLDRGVDVNAKSSIGSTALMLAAGLGHREAVEEFLAHGADVTARNEAGQSAVTLATSNGYLEVAQLLREAGAPD